MKALHKRQVLTNNKGLKSKEGGQRRLCSNSVNTCSPSLGLNTKVVEKMLINELAQIIVDIYLECKRNAHKPDREGI